MVEVAMMVGFCLTRARDHPLANSNPAHEQPRSLLKEP